MVGLMVVTTVRRNHRKNTKQSGEKPRGNRMCVSRSQCGFNCFSHGYDQYDVTREYG